MRPPGAGPFRALVYNHGSEAEASYEDRRAVGRFFQLHGYVVLFPHRRGASGSEGVHWKERVAGVPDAQRSAAIVHAIEEENDDVIAAIEWVRRLTYVDPRRVAVAGCSFGGIHALLAAERSQSIYAAIDFAGASMSWSKSRELRDRLELAASNARVPVFFLQAENDFDTQPSLVLSKVMAREGKTAKMKIYPAHGTTQREGHRGFCNDAISTWGDDVLGFLSAHARDGVDLRKQVHATEKGFWP
jgi:dienelactone hydrolase